MAGLVNDATVSGNRFPLLLLESLATDKLKPLYLVCMNLVNSNATPGFLGKVPVVSCQLVANALGNTGGAVYRYGPWRNKNVPQQLIKAHQVVHMGVAYKNGIKRAQDSFG
jgi:hypothetical protein